MMVDKTRVMVMLSGRGSNFIALADDMAKNPHHRIVAVASDNPQAKGLTYARDKNIPIVMLDYTKGKAAAEQTLQEFIAREGVYYILLAGFMKILSRDFVQQFKNRIINIHPSLLPQYPGLNTHQRVIDAGEKEHGCSVHVVDETLDGGRLLAQRAIKIFPGDNAATLAEKVLALEHELYPFVLQHIDDLIGTDHEQ